MEKVMTPDVYPLNPHPGTQPPNGPQNLVEAVEALPFDQIEGGGWSGKDVHVVSFWTEKHRDRPIRFVLSDHAVEILAKKLAACLNPAQ